MQTDITIHLRILLSQCHFVLKLFLYVPGSRPQFKVAIRKECGYLLVLIGTQPDTSVHITRDNTSWYPIKNRGHLLATSRPQFPTILANYECLTIALPLKFEHKTVKLNNADINLIHLLR